MKRALFFLCACGGVFQAAGAEDAPLSASGADSVALVEKSDWMRYDDGAYLGHVYREVRASIVPEDGGGSGSQAFRGNFFVLEETLRDLKASARAVNAVVPARFRVFKNGAVEVRDDRGFPAMRGFPVYAGAPVSPGAKWTAEGERALDPLGDGNIVVVPFVAEYEYKGVELYKDIPVHRIHARYAARYAPGRARTVAYAEGRAPFNGLSGKHDVDILIRVSNGALLLSRDNLDETFFWPDGKTVRFRGFTLTFGRQLLPMNRDALAADIERAVDPRSGVRVSKVEEGVRLTVQNLRFKPDSGELVSGEEARLDAIAGLLATMPPERTFLVEGHTAAAGACAGEAELSVARARRVVDELCARGLDAGRFIYKGWGSAKSVAPNDTEEGRIQNRRVEITIIE